MSLRIIMVGVILGLATAGHAKPLKTQRMYAELERNDYAEILGNSRDFTKAQIDACLTIDRDLYNILDPESRAGLGIKANESSRSYEELEHFYGLMNCERALRFSAVAVFRKMQQFKSELDLLKQRSMQGEMIYIERYPRKMYVVPRERFLQKAP